MLPAERPKLSWQNVLAGLDIKLLRVFMAVVEEDGFVGAQTRLNIAPSTLSEHIKDLEYRLGFTVCLRGRRGFKLTAQGENLYQAARSLFGQLEAFRNRVSEIANRTEGVLNVGVVDGLATETLLYLPGVLQELSTQKPQVEINLSVGSPPDLEIAVLEGVLDIVIGPFSEKRHGLLYEFIYNETLSLFCGASNKLFGRQPDEIEERDVVDLPLVACDFPSQIEKQFNPHVLVRTIEASTLLILSGRYIGFLPRHVAVPYVLDGRLWEIDQARFAYNAPFSVVSRDVGVKDPMVKLLLTLLRKAATLPRD